MKFTHTLKNQNFILKRIDIKIFKFILLIAFIFYLHQKLILLHPFVHYFFSLNSNK